MAETKDVTKVSFFTKIKKPISAFFLFCKEKHQEFLQKYPDIKNLFELTKFKAEAYKKLAPEEKANYEDKAKEDKKRYDEEKKTCDRELLKNKESSFEDRSPPKKMKLTTEKENSNPNSTKSKKKKIITHKSSGYHEEIPPLSKFKLHVPFPGVADKLLIAETEVEESVAFILQNIPRFNGRIFYSYTSDRLTLAVQDSKDETKGIYFTVHPPELISQILAKKERIRRSATFMLSIVQDKTRTELDRKNLSNDIHIYYRSKGG